MGIEFSRSYKASDGKCYATLKEAQEVELERIIRTHVGTLENVSVRAIVKHLIEDAALVLNVLTTSENSRPKARAVNGATRKPRKPKLNSALPDYTETQRPDGVQTAA